jgi:hypothetical protein
LEDIGGFDFCSSWLTFPVCAQNLKVLKAYPFIFKGCDFNVGIFVKISTSRHHISCAKFMESCEVLPKIWNYVKFCQKYRIISSFVKNIELFFNFVKNMKLCEVLPKIWNYVKFCQKYIIVSILAKNIEFFLNFAKNMELCEVLPKIWNYVKFAKNIKLVLSFAKFVELCQVLPKIWSYVLVLPKYEII